MNKKIFWIASYPKSGNTWMRAILTSLFFTKDGLFSFDLFSSTSIFEHAERFEFVKELNLDDYNKLSELEILSKYWIEGQNKTVIKGDFAFFKTHHACIAYNNNNFTSKNNTLGTIYMIRDPRDVVISYSQHLGKNIDETIYLMKKIGAATLYKTGPNTKNRKYFSYISSWDDNIKSWENVSYPKMIIKYEDLLDNPAEKINDIINFFNKNYNVTFTDVEKKINNIIDSTNFEKFRNFENQNGFIEATKHSNFFREGKKKQWQKLLTFEQTKDIEKSFQDIMKKYNYL